MLLSATVLHPVISLIMASSLTAAHQVALVHTVFNVAAAVVALLIIPRAWPHLEGWLHSPAGSQA